MAVLDSIHGAGIIASRLRELGIDAEALEVYHSNHSVERFSLVVAPVHLSPQNSSLSEARRLRKRIISHHRAVGMILGERDFRAVEITGTRGKTTTALLLALMLSHDMRVVSHTTSGIELWNRGRRSLIRSGLSITPGNLIAAHQIASEERADFLISEVSLGGTGAFDVGIITSLAGDYLIAGGSMWASTAKLQMLSLSDPDARIVANTDAKLSADITFGHGGDVRICRRSAEIRGRSLPLSLDEALDLPAYSDGIAGALAAAISIGVNVKDAADALEGFQGFEGRMARYQLDGVSVTDNSNSGLKVSGIERALDLASGGRTCLVAGEDAESVCEGLDIDALLKMIKSRRNEIDELVLVGRRLEPYAQQLGGCTARNFQEGLEVARRLVSAGDHLVLCVKCFR
ncbi:Mur ligase, middle domain protein [Methanothrix thermoacetophila PT]|uniref:Mur ligase, middle domain protein n=1 Tax=Methanothrix thermoacetophila (strain DSM 6194 / JCM 14653 / NBRC 101360 / PT) TaxID=349307 RepID=A0B5D3_METTP|nr:Mur ligase, middle domain protein [Methanothrix thermoacetophila PT]